jgi:hypothetical protein
MIALVGLILLVPVNSQPRTYSVNILSISQPDARPPVSSAIPMTGSRIVTFSGAPVVIDVIASGFECPHQDLTFMFSYVYRRVRPTNFLEDPSLYVMEGFMITDTVISETCSTTWTTPTMRDGIHTIGVLAYDGAGAQSPWTYVTIEKNNLRGDVSKFPGGHQNEGRTSEGPPISSQPNVIIDTPTQFLSIGSDPLQYVDIHFHTNYPFLIEYFYVEWEFVSEAGCTYSSYSVVYPSGFNQGVFHLDISSVFAAEWEQPANDKGRCPFGSGVFIVTVSCKAAGGMGDPSSITISLK